MNDKIRKVLEVVAKAPTYKEQAHGYTVPTCCFCNSRTGEEHKVDCPVPIAKGLLKDTHPHLSAEQIDTIRSRASETLRELILMGDSDVMERTIDARLDTMSIERQLEEIDVDYLNFDPETGEDNEE